MTLQEATSVVRKTKDALRKHEFACVTCREDFDALRQNSCSERSTLMKARIAAANDYNIIRCIGTV